MEQGEVAPTGGDSGVDGGGFGFVLVGEAEAQLTVGLADDLVLGADFGIHVFESEADLVGHFSGGVFLGAVNEHSGPATVPAGAVDLEEVDAGGESEAPGFDDVGGFVRAIDEVLEDGFLLGAGNEGDGFASAFFAAMVEGLEAGELGFHGEGSACGAVIGNL
ncbi:MAG: hypothetical protein CMO55_14585 [Verrucomicrobiales bacterium]|nr:hypothetical protein [Verrucomicrobiales bacterium]